MLGTKVIRMARRTSSSRIMKVILMMMCVVQTHIDLRTGKQMILIRGTIARITRPSTVQMVPLRGQPLLTEHLATTIRILTNKSYGLLLVHE